MARALTNILAAVAVAAAAASGAAAQNSRKVPDAPLDFDPARPEAVEGWWSNGNELLRLEPSGAYRLWLTQDRFLPPVEVGAWRRSNHAFFDLEPYSGAPGTRHRVDLRKNAGTTELHREGMSDFRSIARPPKVFGDEVLGAWISPVEELLVHEDGRYDWRRTSKAPGITRHAGQWMAVDGVLTLAPDSDSIASVEIRAARLPDGTVTLEGPGGGRLCRPAIPAPAPAAVPPGADPGPPRSLPSGAAGAPPAGREPAPSPGTASGPAPPPNPRGDA